MSGIVVCLVVGTKRPSLARAAGQKASRKMCRGHALAGTSNGCAAGVVREDALEGRSKQTQHPARATSLLMMKLGSTTERPGTPSALQSHALHQLHTDVLPVLKCVLSGRCVGGCVRGQRRPRYTHSAPHDSCLFGPKLGQTWLRFWAWEVLLSARCMHVLSHCPSRSW